MFGVQLNQPIVYKHASLRFFKAGEHHVSRICEDDVLLLVFDGVLRFTEDGKAYELFPGQYHIQRHGSVQDGRLASDAPKYLYVHFSAEWAEGDTVLPASGTFDYDRMKMTIEEMDRAAHGKTPYIIKAGKFYELLSALYPIKTANSIADTMADYIAKECHRPIRLEMLCKEFHFSKNHIIHIFKKAFGMTPVAYINSIRLQKAEYWMEVTSDSLDSIAMRCGYQDYSHFYKLFYRKHNQSPEQWRTKQQKGK